VLAAGQMEERGISFSEIIEIPSLTSIMEPVEMSVNFSNSIMACRITFMF
jgi:hypothetical protein